MSIRARKWKREHSSVVTIAKLIAPHHWLTWLVFGGFAVIVRLPLNWQCQIGRKFAQTLAKLIPRRTEVIRTNLRLAFPHLNKAEQEQLLAKSIDSLGLTFVETMYVWLRGVESLLPRITLEGLEHLSDTHANSNGGTVLVGAHFASLDLVGAALSLKSPFGIAYRRQRNPVSEYFARRSRKRYYSTVVEANELRALVRELRRGETMWFAADQDMGKRKTTCFVPFFGVDASTVVTPYWLARKTGSKAVFMSHTRDEQNCTWKLQLTPIELADATDLACHEIDAAKVNRLIEDVVRSEPSQYFWVHRRYKSMANGSRRDYESAS